MKIAIDVSSVVYGTGVSKYTENLVKHLLDYNRNNNYILFAGTLRQRDSVKRFYSSLDGDFEGKIFPFPPKLADFVWNRLHVLPLEYAFGKIDVFHSSDWTQPPSKAFCVTTIHDLSPIVYPDLVHPRIVSVHKRRLSWVRKEADRIIVPSKATKQELLKYDFSEERIRVIPEAVESYFQPATQKAVKVTKKALQIRGKYFLAVGVNPRKNVERIFKAFEKARIVDATLVFVGRVDMKVPKNRAVRYLGYVPDEYLPALYTGAEALIYTPIYEGFGLPVLQAMACECPVVTSNTSSLPEVAGKAAVLVNPMSVNSILDGILFAVKNRKKLSSYGILQSKQFSWERTACETLNVYSELNT